MENSFDSKKINRRFAEFAWFVVAFNMFVIVLGAFVRASRSGDGCGASYPLCNGMIVPGAAEIKTIIEFSHRLSSALAMLLIIGLLVWAFRAFPRKHLVRKGAVLSFVFILTEAAIGAGLVLFKLVADNDSIARAFWMAGHLINTFILLAVLTLTAFWATNATRRLIIKGNEVLCGFFAVALFGMVLVGTSGAIAALGDTLFPSNSLAEGIRQDFSDTAHILIRLRVWHPLLSILAGSFTALLAAWHIWQRQRSSNVKRAAFVVLALVAAQIIAGTINVLLLTPIWMQLVHLLLADLLWLSLVLLAAVSLSLQTVESFAASERTKTALETANV